MKINQNIVKFIYPTSSGSLLTDQCSGAFLNHIGRAALLAAVLGVVVFITTGCSSIGTGFKPLLISPVPNNTQATNPQDDSLYQPPRSPGFNPDLFGG
jgi:hypothetical protein